MPAPAPRPLSDYPQTTFDKLRYNDTDRQGHVNNAVFATLLETGRVEFLYAPDGALHDTGCAFVIAGLSLNFLKEITWPGRVDIGTGVTDIGRSSFTLSQGLYQNGQCVATAQTTIVQMNESTRRSHPLSPETLQRLQALKLASPQATTEAAAGA